jgi:hypothetical protein
VTRDERCCVCGLISRPRWRAREAARPAASHTRGRTALHAREEVIGDLQEEWDAVAKARGPRLADEWCAAHALISYSSRDQAFCETLNQALRANGVHTSFFPEEPYDAGEPLWQQIAGSLEASASVVVVASQQALTSPAVLREIGIANEIQSRRKSRV